MSPGQLDLDLVRARAARDAGIAAAADHAERVRQGWREAAYKAFVEHARGHATFTVEDVRAANPDLDDPPDRRAWGAVPLRAVRAGIVRRDGFAIAKVAHVHRSIVSTWRSLIFGGPLT